MAKKDDKKKSYSKIPAEGVKGVVKDKEFTVKKKSSSRTETDPVKTATSGSKGKGLGYDFSQPSTYTGDEDAYTRQTRARAYGQDILGLNNYLAQDHSNVFNNIYALGGSEDIRASGMPGKLKYNQDWRDLGTEWFNQGIIDLGLSDEDAQLMAEISAANNKIADDWGNDLRARTGDTSVLNTEGASEEDLEEWNRMLYLAQRDNTFEAASVPLAEPRAAYRAPGADDDEWNNWLQYYLDKGKKTGVGSWAIFGGNKENEKKADVWNAVSREKTTWDDLAQMHYQYSTADLRDDLLLISGKDNNFRYTHRPFKNDAERAEAVREATYRASAATGQDVATLLREDPKAIANLTEAYRAEDEQVYKYLGITSGLPGGISSYGEYYDNVEGTGKYQEDLAGIMKTQGRYEEEVNKANALSSSVRQDPEYSTRSTYRQYNDHGGVKVDPVVMSGMLDYENDEGISNEQYQNYHTGVLLNEYVNAGNDEQKIAELDMILRSVPQLQNSVDLNLVKHLSPAQKQDVFALINKAVENYEFPQEAIDYIDGISYLLQRSQFIEEQYNYTNKIEGSDAGAWTEYAKSFFRNIPNTIAGYVNNAKGLLDPEFRENMTPYNATFENAWKMQAAQGNIAKKAGDWGEQIEVPLIGDLGGAAEFGAQGLNSLVNMYAQSLAGGGNKFLTLANMYGNTFNNAWYNNLVEGDGDMLDAMVEGFAEVVTEAAPLDIIADDELVPWKKILKTGGAEGIGEGLTTLINMGWDKARYGEYRDWADYENMLHAYGYSPEEIKAEKRKFMAGTIAKDMLMGELMGAGFAAPSAIGDYFGMKSQGNAIQDSGDLQGFVDVAKTLGLEGDAAQALADLDAQLQAEETETAAPEADTLTDKEFEENFSDDIAEEAPAQIDAQGVVDAVMADVSGQIEGDVSAAVETAVADAIDFIAEEANENGGENGEGVIDTAMIVAENAMGDVSAQDAQKLKNSIRTALTNAYDTFKAEGSRMAESAKQKNANKAEAEARAESQRQSDAEKAAQRESEMKREAAKQAWEEIKAAGKDIGKTADEVFKMKMDRTAEIFAEMKQKAADVVESHAAAEAAKEAKQAEQTQREKTERSEEGKREDTSDFVAPQEWREAEQNMREREERSDKSKETLELDDADAVEQAEKNARERAERADVAKDTLDVEDVESIKKAEQTMRDKAERSNQERRGDASGVVTSEQVKTARDKGERSSKGKRSKVSAAKIGLIYRASMAKLDAQAQEVLSKAYARTLEGQLAEKNITGDAAKTISQQLADMIGGKDATPYIKNLITNNEAVRQIYLDSMAKVESTNANRGYMMGMGEFGYSPNAVTPTIADEEPGDPDEIKIEAKEGDSASDIVAKNAQVYLGEQAVTMESMYNAETQDAAEYAEAFVRASNYGKDGRDIDVVLKAQQDGGSLSALTTEQVKAAYTIGREMQQNAPTAARKNSKGITVGKVDMRGINMGSLNKHQRASVYTAARLAKAVGFNIRFVESKANARGQYTTENGSWDSRTMTLTLDVHAGSNSVTDTNYAMMHTMGHELTHYIKQFADTALWNDYQSFVMSHLSTKMDNAVLDGKIAKMMQQQKGLTREGAIEEIIADASVEALKNITEADIQKIADTNPGLLKKIANYIQKWVKETKAAIASAYSGTDIKHNAFAQEMTDVLDETSKRWNELLANAAKNRRAETANAAIENAGIEVNENGDTAYIENPEILHSLRSFNQSDYVTERDKAAAALAKRMGITIEKAKAYIDDVTSIAAIVAADRDRLDFEAEDEYSAMKHNSEYKYTMDFSTLCKKRLLYTGTFDAIQKQMSDVALTENDYIRLRQMMAERGYEVACAFCYVESRRKNNGEIINKFLDVYKEAQKNGTDMELGAKNRRKAFKPEAGFTPKIADFNTSEGIANIMHNHRGVYDAYMYFMNARGVSKPKLIESRTDYRSEILKKFRSASAVRAMNRRGGLRLQSFSDFEVINMLDMMQVVMDMSRVGLMSQAYTKVPAFARVFGGTGVKINLSLVTKGVDANGKLIFDDVEGMPHEEAFKIRDMYSEHVGTILVGKDDATIRAAMADPRIDFIIPYHASGWSTENQNALGIGGYTNFTAGQNETNAATGKGVKNFQPSEYWDYSKTGDENAQIYLEKCREAGRVPKFPQYQNYPGYWKMLIDFKMYDNSGVGSPQRAVRPDFNLGEARAIMDNYSGGHQNLPVARDVVRDFVKEYQQEHDADSLKLSPREVDVEYQNDIRYSPRDFEQAEKTAKEGFAAWCKKVESLSETEYKELKENTPLIMVSRDTPEIFRKYGAKNLKMLIRLDALYLAIREDGVQEGNYHRLGAENMESLVNQLDDPDVILRTEDGRLKALVRVNTKRGQAMASVELETKKDYEGKHEDVNLIVTAFDYERRYLKGQFTKYGAKVLHKKETLSQVNPQLHEWLESFNESASGGIVTQIEPVVKKQARDLSELSDRELLVQALEGELTEAERDHLNRYKGRVEELEKKQMQLEAINSKIAELKANGATAKTSDELRAAQTNAKTLRDSIAKVDAKLNQIESAKMIREVVKRNRAEARKQAYALARERADERQRKAVEHAREVGQRKVERVKESHGKEKYKAQILKDVKKLHGWLTTPTMKGSVPQFLRAPVAEFLESIDFTSSRALNGGEATKSDAKFADALDKLRKAVSDINKNQSDIEGGAADFSGYIDLPADYAAEFDDLVDKIKTTLKMGYATEAPFNRMTAEQLHNLSKMFRILNSSISKTNRLIANARYESAKTASDDTITDMNSMTAKVKTNKALAALNSVFNWKNTTPYYAFQRLGRGGKAIFEGLQDGWDKMAHNSAKLIKYAEDTFNGDESKAWGRETDTITLESGETVQMTTAQKMSLYCHSKRAQSVGHLMGGGIRIADIHGKRGSTISQAENYVLTQKDINNIIKSLTARQIEVADALQEFMNTTCKEWGNEISMKRFGFEQMTEENYFPIKTDANNRASVDESKDGSSSMFRLLNMSSLKPVTPKANNAIIIDNIFDVFSNHAADMAKYNALALPILDFIKWYNYVERTDVVDANGNATGQIKTRSTQKALEHAYGKDAKDYLRTFIKDLNAEHDGGRNDHIVNKLLNRAKAASVGANVRVWMLQITSAPRAAYAISPKYLIKAAATRGDGSKAQDAIGILKWKDLGFYSTDMNNSVRDKVKRDGSKFDKVREWQMAPAGWGDALTANIIYKAAQYEMADKHPDLKPGTNAYKTMLNRRVREIVYKTQVVDSTMTRSDLMRSKGVWPLLTSFMSEPTLSVNMLNEGIQQAVMKKRGLEDADLKPGSNIGKAAAAFAASAAFGALVGAIANAFRDDDEYEKFRDKYWDAFWDELRGNFEIWDMLPLVKDVADAVKAYINEKDYAPSTLLTQALTYLVETATAVKEYREGKRTLTNVIFNGLKTLSYGSGLGAYNFVRDVSAIYNTCIANAVNLPRIQMYADKEKDASGALYRVAIEGDTEAFEFYADRAELYGITAEDLENDFVKLIGDEVEAGNLDSKQAVEMLMQYGGKTKYQAETAVSKAVYEQEYGSEYSKLEKQYVAGEIDKQHVIKAMVDHGEKFQYQAEEQILKWDYEKETGRKFSQMQTDYLRGDITRANAVKWYSKYGSVDAEDAEREVLKWDYQKVTNRPWDKLMYDYIDGKYTTDQTLNFLMKYGDKDEADAWDTIDKYNYAKVNGGDAEGYSKYVSVHEAIAADEGVQEAVNELVDKFVSRGKNKKDVLSSIRGSITSKYKPIYLAASETERKQMLPILLDAYVAAGGKRSTYNRQMTYYWFKD